MAIEFPILWGKNKDGKDGFVVSHVKQIYYDWKSKKMLSDKLDDMDEIITANADAIAERLVTNDALATALANYVTKSMMSGQQVNDANMVPTSALAYAMQQAITKNAGDISTLNGNLSTKVSITNNAQLVRIELTTDETNVFTIYAKRDDGIDYAFWITKVGVKLGAYIDGQWQIFWNKVFTN